MIRIVIPVLAALTLAACNAGGGHLEPIPGSITYGGQPRGKLVRSPVGSTFDHTFRDRYGRPVVETYRIEPDRSLRLIHRRVRFEFFSSY
jgi:hypothetical protein